MSAWLSSSKTELEKPESAVFALVATPPPQHTQCSNHPIYHKKGFSSAIKISEL